MPILNPQKTMSERFEKNLVHNRDALRRFISSKVRDRQEVDDLVQETLARTLSSADRNRVKEPFAYAMQVAKTVVIDYWRKERGEPIGEDVVEIADEYCPMEKQSQHQRLRDLVGIVEAMPELRREVFIRRRLDGQTREEIASALGMSVEAVKKHITRAMADLAVGMEAKGWVD